MKITASSNKRIDDICFSIGNILVLNHKRGHQSTINLGEHFRILYISKGGVDFIFSNNCINAKAGDILYIPNNITYRSKWNKVNDSISLMLDIKLLNIKESANLDFGNQPKILFHDKFHFYDELLKDIEHLSYDIPYGWLNRMSMASKILYYILADSSNERHGQNYWKIRNGLRYIEQNFASDFLVSDVADICMMSTENFRRIFKQLKGMSPISYRNKLRIQKSIELLKTGEYNITEAGEAVGINDVKYFSKLFKQTTGLNPSEILKAIDK